MKLQIQYVRPETLKTADYNPRTISRETLTVLAGLLDEHGFVDPVIARKEDSLLLGGHQRIRANALRETPDEFIPCMFLGGLSDTQAKALNVALNNPYAQGEFDQQKLSQLLHDLDEAKLDIAAVTGFSAADIAELDNAIGDLGPVEPIEGFKFGADQTNKSDTESRPGVVIVFEMASDVYERARVDLDGIVGKYDIACHVRIGGAG